MIWTCIITHLLFVYHVSSHFSIVRTSILLGFIINGFNADGCGSGGAGQGAPSGTDGGHNTQPYPHLNLHKIILWNSSDIIKTFVK